MNTLPAYSLTYASLTIIDPPSALLTSHYNIDIYIKYIYNFGVGGIAKFKWLGEYALKPYYMWDVKNGRIKILYKHYSEVSLLKRNHFILESGNAYIDKFKPLYNLLY